MSTHDSHEPQGTTQAIGAMALGRRATRGALWVALGYGGAQLIRFVGNLILTRLLFAEAFGTMALIASLLQGLELFSDLGIAPSLIASDRFDRRFVDTAFTMQVGRGAALCLVAAGLAVPMSRLYDEPALVWMLPVCALNAVFAGCQSTNSVTLNRALNLRRVELMQIGAQLVGVTTMVVWALLAPSVFALVAGSLATGLSRLVMTHVYLPGPLNRFAWDRSALGELARFGRWIFASTVLTFLAGQSDRLVFGALVPMERLGVYSIAMGLATMPSEVLSKLSLTVVFPLESIARRGGQDGAELFEATRRPVMIAGGAVLSALMVAGPTAVEVLYDPRYASAGWIVQVLSVGSWFLVLGSLYGAILLAHGRPQWVMAGNAAKLVGMAALIPTGFVLARQRHPEGDLAGAVAGFAAAEVLRYAVSLAGVRELGLRGLGLDAKLTALVGLVGGGGALLATWLATLGLPPWARLGLLAVVVASAWAPLGWPLLRASPLAERVFAPALVRGADRR